MAGKAPEIGAIVDVEHDLAAVPAHQLHRLALRGFGTGPGEMRAGDDDGTGLGDEGGVDIAFLQRHVGAVLAVEQQREGLVALDREDGERGQAFRVGLETVEIDALAGELLAQETSELLVADAGQQGRAQAKPSGADRDIGGAAADRFGEGGDILQPRADLLAVEIDRSAADGDDVERLRRSAERSRHVFLPALPLCMRCGRPNGSASAGMK